MTVGTPPSARPPRRSFRIAGAVVMVLLTIVGTHLILATERTDREQIKPFVHIGAIGDDVDARTFSVRVLGVRGAHLLGKRAGFLAEPGSDPGYTDTSGVFVLVKIRVTAHTEPVRLSYVSVYDRAGVRYEATTRIKQPSTLSTYEVGTPVECEAVFEVPPQSATSLTIRFGADVRYDDRMATFAEVGLRITQRQVDDWLADEKPAVPESAEVVE